MYYLWMGYGRKVDHNRRWCIELKRIEVEKKRNRTVQNGENYEQGQRKMTRIIFYKNKILFSNYKEKKTFLMQNNSTLIHSILNWN